MSRKDRPSAADSLKHGSAASPAAVPKRRPYRSPTLTVHGDLKTLTAAKGGTMQDGAGKPMSRTTPGGPA
jgi:hypothetical protein